MSQKNKKDQARKRHLRIRRRISGSAERPRLAVYRSVKHIYAQIIDDKQRKTLVSASSIEKEIKSKNLSVDASTQVGELMGKKLNDLKISKAVFDRGGYVYHGRVKSLADGIREKGIEF